MRGIIPTLGGRTSEPAAVRGDARPDRATAGTKKEIPVKMVKKYQDVHSQQVSVLCQFLFLVAVVAAGTAQAQVFTTIYSFKGPPDGEFPYSPLIPDKNKPPNAYGITAVGGASDWGTVYKLDHTGKESVLYSFTGGADGAQPFGGLVMDGAGNLYGTTLYGGSAVGGEGNGVVFMIDLTGKETVLHTFTGGADGFGPRGYLALDSAGNLYGTSSGGGQRGGTLFRLSPMPSLPWKITVLYDFCTQVGCTDGNAPLFGIIRVGEAIYGTTSDGGDTSCGDFGSGCGVVFKFGAGGYKLLYSFHGFTKQDGQYPTGLSSDGTTLYGTTLTGGSNTAPPCSDSGCGTVFSISLNGLNGNETILYNFAGGADGYEPQDAPILDSAGNLYGVTNFGGGVCCGTVYELSPALPFWTPTTLHAFTGGLDGSGPGVRLVRDAGNFYGTTSGGGGHQHGAIFKLAP
jgi:uncharacterized repeat protein (TIGR03803 family)